MKKDIIAILLILACAFSFSACGKEPDKVTEQTTKTNTSYSVSTIEDFEKLFMFKKGAHPEDIAYVISGLSVYEDQNGIYTSDKCEISANDFFKSNNIDDTAFSLSYSFNKSKELYVINISGIDDSSNFISMLKDKYGYDEEKSNNDVLGYQYTKSVGEGTFRWMKTDGVYYFNYGF